MRNITEFTAVTALTIVLPLALAQAGSINFTITLDGSQETPAVETDAEGAGTATLDTDTGLFSWNITFADLSAPETAAHFHGPAPQCEPAGVEITLPLGSPKIGSATLSAGEMDAVLDGLWYVNIHTTPHPLGEIRGQVMPSPLDDPVPGPISTSRVHVELETVASGLIAPNWGASAPGDDRLFVTDQNGILWAIDLSNGSMTEFLNVQDRIVPLGIFGEGSFDERGLLGVAFHPGYQKNGLLYTYTSEPNRGAADFSTIPLGSEANHQTNIIEWQVQNPGDLKSVVDPESARVLLTIDQPQFNHNGGALNCDSDGMLYVSLGDGGNADDQDTGELFGVPVVGHDCNGNGQNLASPLGKILRIDPLGTDSANGQYGIPDDNPFVANGEVVEEIFAYGFRNPFRFSFDSETGDLYVGDVGQNDIEEIDLVASGGNYGWNHKEGSFFFVRNGASPGYVTDMPLAGPKDVIDPVAQYDHDEGIAVIGGFVYRGTKIGPLRGSYVFAEFAQTFGADGRFFHLDERNEVLEFPLIGQKELGVFVLGMGQDAHGELYLLVNGTGTPFAGDDGPTGAVVKIKTKDGDFNADGVVNFSDLLVLLASWGPCTGCPADINGDGTVGFADLLVLLANWG